MVTKEKQYITKEIIDQSMSYNAYRALINRLLNEDKTTGTDHSEGRIEYTRKNVQLMNQLDEEVNLNVPLKRKLKSVNEPWVWLVLTEAWCGDAAQNIPVIHKMADTAPQIDLKLILRDEHPEIMEQYLTDGSRSIPKLICLHAHTLDVIGTWGPRPADFQQKALEWKDDPDISKEEWVQMLHNWYAEDGYETIQDDFMRLIDEWNP